MRIATRQATAPRQRKMPSNRRVSYLLVGLQFLCVAIIAVTGPWIARSLLFLLLECAGIALAAWALWTLRVSPPNVLPDVRASATLVRTGPFRWIRHPLYSGLLLACGALVLDAPAPLRVVTWLLLAATLVVKLRYEERLLDAAFPDYAAYKLETRRLIPYVW